MNHPQRLADPPALGELDVDAVHGAEQTRNVGAGHARLVGDDRQRRAFADEAQAIDIGGADRLLDKLEIELAQPLDRAQRLLRVPGGVGIDADAFVRRLLADDR